MEDVTFKDLLNLVDRHEELRRAMMVENNKLVDSNNFLRKNAEESINLMNKVVDDLADKKIEIARLQAIIKTEAEFHVIEQHKELR